MADAAPALERFLASVELKAYRIAELGTGHREDALELVQESMFALVRRYADRPEQDWKPLFYRILENRIRDWHRRRKVRDLWQVWVGRRDADGEADDPVQALPDPRGGGPERETATRQQTERMLCALGRLSRRQQQSFLLRAWEGLDTAQTARAMGCAEGSVKTHYARALQALRGALGEEEP